MIELFKYLEEHTSCSYELSLNEHKTRYASIKEYWRPEFQDDDWNADVDWREGNNIYCFRWDNGKIDSLWLLFISNTLDGLLNKIKKYIEERTK